jgi:hypothetical protein
MKNLFFSIMALLIILSGCTGMQPVTEKDTSFSRIVNIPGIKKDKIYGQAKIWVAENFRSAKAVTEYDDKEKGTIIGNGNMKYPCEGIECIAKNDWRVHFTMRVDTKDEKFRLTFTNLRLSWPARVDSLGYHSAYEGSINQMSDVNKIKPKLLGFGDQIASSITGSKQTDNW